MSNIVIRRARLNVATPVAPGLAIAAFLAILAAVPGVASEYWLSAVLTTPGSISASAFTASVSVNVVLGYLLSVHVFEEILPPWSMKMRGVAKLDGAGASHTVCAVCRHREHDRHALDVAIPGLTSFSPGFETGVRKTRPCRRHGRAAASKPWLRAALEGYKAVTPR